MDSFLVLLAGVHLLKGLYGVKEAVLMEKIRCPNPRCRRRILDNEMVDSEWTVLEIKCQHCGKLVRMYCGPDGINARIYNKKKRRE